MSGGDFGALIAQLNAQRDSWVELSPGKAIKLRRPLEGDMEQMFRLVDGSRRFRIGLADVCRCAVDWRGITEADLLGAGIGNTDPLPFSPEVCTLAIGDNLDWLQAAVEGLTAAILQRIEQRATARGNSSATSTPPPTPTVATSTAATTPTH